MASHQRASTHHKAYSRFQDRPKAAIRAPILMIPAILIGAYLGSLFIKHIKESPFRYLVLGMAMIASLNLIFR